jgi:serine/threonine-protein kinase
LAELDGHYGDVIVSLERALRLAPAFAEAHELLGRLEMESGRVQDGSRRLFLAAELDARRLPSLALVARSALFRGRDDVATRVARRIEGGPALPLELLLLRARLAIWRGEPNAPSLAPTRAAAAQLDLPLARALIEATLRAAEGDVDPLLAFATRIEKEAPHARYMALLHQLCTEALAGRDREGALDQLEGADWHGLFDLEWLDRCPPLRTLADDPRFGHVRDRVARRVLRV